MIIDQTKPIRTGIPGLKNSAKKNTPSVGAKTVSNPIIRYEVGSGIRAIKVGKKPPFDMEAIKNGYLADCYIRQGIDKYVELIIKEGWHLEGGKDQVDYLNKRFKYMGYMTSPPEHFDFVIDTAVRNFIQYGNTLLLFGHAQTPSPIPGMNLKGLNSKNPIIGIFNVSVVDTKPVLDEKGRITDWINQVSGRKVIFPVENIRHFTYCKEPGNIWGVPNILSVIDDIRALRQAEENVLKLIYKHLNPLIHQTVPDVTGDGQGTPEDIDDAVRNIQNMAPDGYIVTPPGHEIKTIGAESQAIRAEGYLKFFLERVFSGLAVPGLMFGAGESITAGSAEVILIQMYHKAKLYQQLLSWYFTFFILNELLLEGGFNPVDNEEDRVIWKWNEIEIDRRIKEESHVANLWSLNTIGYEEVKKRFHLEGETNWKDFYSHRIQIPQLIASQVAMDPLDTHPDELRQVILDPPDVTTVAHTPGTKDKPPTKKITTLSKATKNVTAPKNQHSEDAINDIFTITEEILRMDKESIDEGRILSILNNYIPTRYSSYVSRLTKTLLKDKLENDEISGAIRINARMANERVTLIGMINDNYDK